MTAFSVCDQVVENTIPTPEQLRNEMPANESQLRFVAESRRELEAILSGQDNRLVLIVGPCSLHDLESTYEFARRLKKLATACASRFFIIMRTYFEKARTSKGWKGMLYDPDLDGTYDMGAGLRLSRKILLDLASMRVATATELLEINTAHYLTDLLTWGCIGARTSSSQPHRELAASLNFPVGFKNSTDGNILNAVHGVVSASSSHVFLGMGKNGELAKQVVAGNPFCHVVLRGSDHKTNYDIASVASTLALCNASGISDKIVIDCSHGNSGKKPERQIDAFEEVMEQRNEGNLSIVGAMLESNLFAGSQSFTSSPQFGLSLTDPCLDWSTTEKLIQKFF